MTVTIILSAISIVALCLLLYAAVAFIQDRRFFTTAPKAIQAAALEHEERFPGQRIMRNTLRCILKIFQNGSGN